mmetsp:Transcript_25478/g.53329  ORF Transcript_25478/g.53329 Transcript_25478/m.53329 type:complete len:693 (+) Transcript_25478:80-2158(+)
MIISNGNPKLLLPYPRPFQPTPISLSRPTESDIKNPDDFLNLNPINLPRPALNWSLAASFAAAISYADRSTSAIAASSLLDELKWTEGDLGDVQSAFFLGYALTQVFGGVLGGIGGDSELDSSKNYDGDEVFDGNFGDDGQSKANSRNNPQTTATRKGPRPEVVSQIEDEWSKSKKRAGYRTILPISLILTGLATLLFPYAAIHGGPTIASIDRFVLGLMEGLLLPAAMAGVGATTAITKPHNANYVSDIAFTSNTSKEMIHRGRDESNKEASNIKATASAIVIAGCYLGSAWAYLAAWGIFSEPFQKFWMQLGSLVDSSIWPLVFYINGFLSMVFVLFWREEFDFDFSWLFSDDYNHDVSTMSLEQDVDATILEEKEDSTKTPTRNSSQTTKLASVWNDTLKIAKETLSSKSGRAILAAQIGQGALLYTIASWGPLYLERVGEVPPVDSSSATDASALWPPTSDDTSPSSSSSAISSTVATAASVAASSLILPQLTQALVGLSIGATADQLSSRIGTRFTRRALQILSGTGPALILWFSTLHLDIGGAENITGDNDMMMNEKVLTSAPSLFGAAQTLSALSLGAVSVSHLDIATPSTAGAVYALGNVAAAASGSVMVNLFGKWLEGGDDGSVMKEAFDEGGVGAMIGGGREFDVPFRVVALLSAFGSLWYGITVDTNLEIGVNVTRVDVLG